MKWQDFNTTIDQEQSSSSTKVRSPYKNKWEAERMRKQRVILSLILQEAERGNTYTMKSFAYIFEGHYGLGSAKSIYQRLEVYATQSYIKFFQNTQAYGLSPVRDRFGLMCLKNMVLGKGKGKQAQPVHPTHYKNQCNGEPLPINDNSDID